eukprot:2556058-Rhodomonas_salina.1
MPWQRCSAVPHPGPRPLPDVGRRLGGQEAQHAQQAAVAVALERADALRDRSATAQLTANALRRKHRQCGTREAAKAQAVCNTRGCEEVRLFSTERDRPVRVEMYTRWLGIAGQHVRVEADVRAWCGQSPAGRAAEGRQRPVSSSLSPSPTSPTTPTSPTSLLPCPPSLLSSTPRHSFPPSLLLSPSTHLTPLLCVHPPLSPPPHTPLPSSLVFALLLTPPFPPPLSLLLTILLVPLPSSAPSSSAARARSPPSANVSSRTSTVLWPRSASALNSPSRASKPSTRSASSRTRLAPPSR